ncbi:hypothetical protein TruAng_003779 [Truncatella angustata]|nr:hypothetical protein TruAng_003779 [Truncatella angustata]
MESLKASAINTGNTSGRKQHKPTSSLGSLYEVLADLDETQLHYLIQEMSHTGHQNVPVSQAVSAFESHNPSDSLNNVRASMLPPVQGMRRQLSKSQRGKLRLQTAFQRAPSLRQRRPQDLRDIDQSAVDITTQSSNDAPAPGHPIISNPVNNAPKYNGTVGDVAPILADRSQRRENPVEPHTLQSPMDSRKKSPAYRRIPRPDFSLPPGVTVIDLLELLEAEFLSSNSHQFSSPDFSSSPSSAFSAHTSSSPSLLSPASSSPFSQKPNLNGPRSLRRHTSRLDMALDADRTASGAEEIGLGMLEPRPQRTVSLGSPAVSAPISSVESFDWGPRGDTKGLPSTPPVVLEGIFDVLENQ